MDRQSIKKQLEIEHALIDNIVASLRSALDWKTEPSNASRKLSTLRFVAETFHRHLERLMAIHEYDGYMSCVVQLSPHLAPAVEVLKHDHAQLREEIIRVATRLERAPAEDPAAVENLSDSLQAVLATYDKHNEMEAELLQESFLRDVGGPG